VEKLALNGATIVFDLGKTHAKVSLWDESAKCITKVSRSNQVRRAPAGYRCLDVEGIDPWLLDTLSHFAQLAPVRQIIPVAHGAAFALVQGKSLVALPMDYEEDIEPEILKDYLQQRDDFSLTGSPALPLGLNLGTQLHRYEALFGPFSDQLQILTWPQYWSWRLSGVASCEVTSLGCHSDLWNPLLAEFSPLAQKRGWAQRFAPLYKAGDVLGPVSDEIIQLTGLSSDCQVHCGIHDSNGALVAARGCPELASAETTVLSTGTWFIALRSTGKGSEVRLEDLEEKRDCLVNVDAYGQPVPSARFMGGREFELLGGIDDLADFSQLATEDWLQRLGRLATEQSFLMPSMATGTGPFPDHKSHWVNRPADAVDRHILIQLYLALMVNACLELIGTRSQLLIEGRFGRMPVFSRALATLRSDVKVYRPLEDLDVAYGALRLIDPQIKAPSSLEMVLPLAVDLTSYANQWRQLVGNEESV